MSKLWIEQHFQKRECIRFIPTREPNKCGCGATVSNHPSSATQGLLRAHSIHSQESSQTSSDEHWSPLKHTLACPTDSYGMIEFQGSAHPLRAQYVRLSFDTRPEFLLQLLTREWQLELPKLLITVHGGKANFELQPKLKAVLRQGLVKAAKTTGAWIFTAGTNTGVMRHVGEALVNERTPRLRGRVLAIGIAPWGIIDNRADLIGKNVTVPCHSISSPKSRFAVLNNHHSYFILVDNGTTGRYGAEIALRKKLEKYISQQKIYTQQVLEKGSTSSSTRLRAQCRGLVKAFENFGGEGAEMEACGVPVVSVVVEGGLNTIRTVLEYVTDNPPVPVVICDGSGRAADLLAFAHRYMQDDDTLLDSMREQLMVTIERTFQLNREQAEKLHLELIECVRRKDLITVFRMGEGPCQELDQAVLTALLKGHHMPAPDQLRLALTWNRVDIARSEIFVYGQEWPPGALEQAMMDALVMDSVDFVKLMLENGVSMHKFLSIPRLEDLYNSRYGPNNTLQYLVRDVRKNVPRLYRYTLYDIGLIIEKLMGGAYRSSYCRRKFRHLYNNVMRKIIAVSATPTLSQTINTAAINNPCETACLRDLRFNYPFNELLLWAVLTNRQKMALFMWQNGEEAIVKALVSCKLYKSMAEEAAQDDMEADICEEMKSNASEFENLALELLDYCYRSDEHTTLKLLTYELQNWSKHTCLGIAVAAKHSAFLAHTAAQMLVADLWMGGLRTRKHTNLKVILGLLFPITILTLEFRTREELHLMPQTEEEHIQEMAEEDEESQGGKDKEKIIRQTHRPLREQYESYVSLRSGSICNSNTRINKIENGKVFPFEASLDFEKDHLKTKQKPLRFGKKIYEFYGAPITKFWGHTMAYGVFLVLYTYVVLVRMKSELSWQEAYVVAYLCTLGLEKIREVVASEPVYLTQKVSVWMEKKWNPCDLVVIIFFLVGVSLRLNPPTLDVGRVIYCLDIMYWYIRSLDLLSVNKYLGPYVTMIGKMVIDMIYFVVLLLVVLMSYGVARQGILNPNEEPSWKLVKEIFFMPYFMLYGEVFADKIDRGDSVGSWINPAIMAIYLLIANILLVNLLIAVFNNIFFEVNAMSQQVWKSQRFKVVMEYEQKPLLPPPLIVFSHIHLIIKFCFTRWRGKEDTFDHGLKLFLSENDVQNIHDFEEECVEGYFREKELKLHLSTEEQVRFTTERVETMSQRVEDINHREKESSACIKTLEFRLTKLEDLAEQTAASLAVIHRYIVTSMGESPKMPPISDGREPSEDEDDDDRDSNSSDDGRRHHLFEPHLSLSLEAPKILEPVDSASADEERDVMTAFPKTTSTTKVQFSDGAVSRNKIMASRSDSLQAGPPPSALQQRRLSCLMRQTTVASPESFGTSQSQSVDDSSHTPSLQRGSSISQLEDSRATNLIPARPAVERSLSSASCIRRRNDNTMLLNPMTLRPHLALTRGEYTSITDELESCALSRQYRAPVVSPSKSFTPSFSRQSSAEYQHLLSMESEILHGAEEADYHLMEGLIQRRLHRDSENLTVSLEDLCSVKGESENEDDEERREFSLNYGCSGGGISPSPSAPNVTIDPASDSSPDEPLPKSQSAHSIQTIDTNLKRETMC